MCRSEETSCRQDCNRSRYIYVTNAQELQEHQKDHIDLSKREKALELLQTK